MRIRAAMQAGKVRGEMNSEFYDRLNAYIGRYYVEQLADAKAAAASAPVKEAVRNVRHPSQ